MTQINVSLLAIVAVVVLSQNWLPAFKQWVADRVFVPAQAIVHGTIDTASTGLSGGGSNSGSSRGTNNGTSLFDVPISGPNGSGLGTIQVVAHDAASALENARQGGNTPTGNPVPVS